MGGSSNGGDETRPASTIPLSDLEIVPGLMTLTKAGWLFLQGARPPYGPPPYVRFDDGYMILLEMTVTNRSTDAAVSLELTLRGESVDGRPFPPSKPEHYQGWLAQMLESYKWFPPAGRHDHFMTGLLHLDPQRTAEIEVPFRPGPGLHGCSGMFDPDETKSLTLVAHDHQSGQSRAIPMNTFEAIGDTRLGGSRRTR